MVAFTLESRCPYDDHHLALLQVAATFDVFLSFFGSYARTKKRRLVGQKHSNKEALFRAIPTVASYILLITGRQLYCFNITKKASILHMYWHSILSGFLIGIFYLYVFFWKVFWHSIRQMFWHSICSGICPGILIGIYSGILEICLGSLPAFFLEFYLVQVLHCIAHCDLELAAQAVVPTEIWSS